MLFTGIRPEGEMSQLLRYSDIRWGKSIGLKAEHTKDRQGAMDQATREPVVMGTKV